jgi:hypothetical protein
MADQNQNVGLVEDTKLVYTDPFAPVELTPVHVGGEEVATKVAVRVKADNGKFGVVGFVSPGYQLLSNRRVRDIAEDIMSRTDASLGGFRALKTLFDGKRYVDYFASNNPIVAVENGRSTDLMLGLMVWTSYDGTRATGFEIFALNPGCTNQYHERNRFGFFAWRHTNAGSNKIDMDDALLSISTGAQNVIRAAPLLGAMKKRPLSLPRIIEAKQKTKMPQSQWGNILDQLGQEEASEWGLFQAMTNIASHKLSGLSAIDIGSTITKHFLGDPEKKEIANSTTAAQVVGQRERDMFPANG